MMKTRWMLPLLVVTLFASTASSQIIGTAGGSRGTGQKNPPRIVPLNNAPVLSGVAPTAQIVGGPQLHQLLEVERVAPGGRVYLVVSPARFDRLFTGGVLVPDVFAPGAFVVPLRADGLGRVTVPLKGIPPDARLFLQAWAQSAVTGQLMATQAYRITTD